MLFGFNNAPVNDAKLVNNYLWQVILLLAGYYSLSKTYPKL